VTDVDVTIPALDIKQRNADVVSKAPKRFKVWWSDEGMHCFDGRYQTYKEPDIDVPNEKIIIEK